MVHNMVKYISLPHHSGSHHSVPSLTNKHMKSMGGTGMGSVLLRPGGGGSASSYMDMDDYISTTGINPYARAGMKAVGRGLPSTISHKLSNLNIAPPTQSLRKNIVMSM